MYILKVNLTIKDKEFKAGTKTSDIPEKSVKWLLEQGLIVKVKKNAKK